MVENLTAHRHMITTVRVKCGNALNMTLLAFYCYKGNLNNWIWIQIKCALPVSGSCICLRLRIRVCTGFAYVVKALPYWSRLLIPVLRQRLWVSHCFWFVFDKTFTPLLVSSCLKSQTLNSHFELPAVSKWQRFENWPFIDDFTVVILDYSICSTEAELFCICWHLQVAQLVTTFGLWFSYVGAEKQL